MEAMARICRPPLVVCSNVLICRGVPLWAPPFVEYQVSRTGAPTEGHRYKLDTTWSRSKLRVKIRTCKRGLAQKAKIPLTAVSGLFRSFLLGAYPQSRGKSHQQQLVDGSDPLNLPEAKLGS